MKPKRVLNRKNRLPRLITASWVSICITMAACGGADSSTVAKGPVDGTWKASSITCSGQTVTGAGTTLSTAYYNGSIVLLRTFANSTGSVKITYFGATSDDYCLVTLPLALTYPTAKSIIMTTSPGTLNKVGNGVGGSCSAYTASVNKTETVDINYVSDQLLTLDFAPDSSLCNGGAKVNASYWKQ